MKSNGLKFLLVLTLVLQTVLAIKDQIADSTEIANQIVQQLQSLGHHKYPSMSAARSAPHAAASGVHYDVSNYYDAYGAPHDGPTYVKYHEPEPTMDPNLSPSGINVNAALGYISYLVLLVLLQGAVEGVAARTRRRRSIGPFNRTGDLLGRSLELAGDLGLVSPDGLASLPYEVLTFLNRINSGKVERTDKKFRSGKLQRLMQKKQSM